MNNNKKKLFDADVEADELLEKQFALKDKSGFSNILTAVLCLGFIFAFAVMFWAVPDEKKSESENRELQQVPSFSLTTLLDGTFTSEFATYMADQFPVRDFFVGIKGVSETLQLKMENNSTFVTRDGYLIDRDDYFHVPAPAEGKIDDRIKASNIDKNISYASAFARKMKRADIDFVCAFAGRKQDVLTDKLPATYGSTYSDEVWKHITDYSAEKKLDFINLRDHLRDNYREGLYYRTDHHWTTEGAYEAYVKIMEQFGEEPYKKEDFRIEAATNEFYGTTYQAAGVKWVEADTISYWRYEGDESFTLRILDEPDSEGKRNYDGFEGVRFEGDYAVFDGIYVKDYLNVTDKYSSFIGGNNAYTEIILEGEERETLVIAKDSFSHCMIPFLARHYNLVIVDFRSFNFSVEKLCMSVGADKMLVLCNLDTLGQGNYMGNLRVTTVFDKYILNK